ncbi:MAG: hypothetical protein AAFX79_08470 [Planctomycetota bacterium]
MAARATKQNPRGSTLRLAPPDDYDLARDVCSYGYFLLDPNDWDPASKRFATVLALEDGAAAFVLRQQRIGMPVVAAADRMLSRRESARARGMLRRMLRLDESAESIAAFHDVDPRWRFSGRGRLVRSPTLFEDVAKTVTNCNVRWPGTIDMNAALCARVGSKSASSRHAFPTAEQLARRTPGFLRSRCRVGYRDQRLVDLAKLFVRGEIDEAWLEDAATPDDEVRRFLLELPGIGPFAANNIMQLLGRYGRIPLDTESVRHGRTVLGFDGTDRAIMKRVEEFYAKFGLGDGGQAFRSYWFDLWMHYEQAKGPATTWEKRTTGRDFTAAQLKTPRERPKPRKRQGQPSAKSFENARKSKRSSAPLRS